MKKVSVCIPVYNGERFIKETIEMVLAQDYENIEVLVSDNASTDGTIKEIRRINDKRVKLFQNSDNLGMGANWNCLLDKASGEYLIIVCADDYLLPGAIRKKVEILENNPDVNIVFSASCVMSEQRKIIFKRRPYKKSRKFNADWIQKQLFIEKNIFAEPTNNMLRRSAVEQVGEFDINLWYTIDWDYWLRILNTGNAYYLDEILSGFRIFADSATGSNLNSKERIMADEEVFIKKYKSGNIMPLTQEMIDRRRKNVENRLFMKIVFMKILRFLSIFA